MLLNILNIPYHAPKYPKYPINSIELKYCLGWKKKFLMWFRDKKSHIYYQDGNWKVHLKP